MSTVTASALWDALHNWATSVLGGNVEVTPSHEDAPSPDGMYICIGYAGTWRLAGTTASRMLADDPQAVDPRVYVYRGTVQVREVEGDGDALMLLLESLETPEVEAAFSTAGISVLRSTGPTAMPALQGSLWRRESLLELEVSWARAYAGTALTIESVGIQQVDGSGQVLRDIEVNSGWTPPTPPPQEEETAQGGSNDGQV